MINRYDRKRLRENLGQLLHQLDPDTKEQARKLEKKYNKIIKKKFCGL